MLLEAILWENELDSIDFLKLFFSLILDLISYLAKYLPQTYEWNSEPKYFIRLIPPFHKRVGFYKKLN